MPEIKEGFITLFEERNSYQKVIRILDDGFEDAIQFMNEPQEYHQKLRTTNNLERLNSEIRRRERVIRIFPNTQSAFRLIGAVLMELEKDGSREQKISLLNFQFSWGVLQLAGGPPKKTKQILVEDIVYEFTQ